MVTIDLDELQELLKKYYPYFQEGYDAYNSGDVNKYTLLSDEESLMKSISFQAGWEYAAATTIYY